MTQPWQSAEPPQRPDLSRGDLLRACAKALPLGLWIGFWLAVLLLLRLVEGPLYGLRRPVTPYITQMVCRTALWWFGLRYRISGQRMTVPGPMVANHGSWLDIFALNAAERLFFVSKDEVRGWPGIGWLARATGTLFIRRDRREAKRHTQSLEARLKAGQRLLFFPEGTSSDGLRVLPFKTPLFQAVYAEGLPEELAVQPVTVIYTAPAGQDQRFFGWWGDMEFGSHLMEVLAFGRGGAVEVVFHPALPVRDFDGRKDLALAAEQAVRSGFEGRRVVGAGRSAD